MFKIIILYLVLFCSCCVFAYDANMVSDIYRSSGKQQQKTEDLKGRAILVTPHYESYADRNFDASEKIVAIYDKKSPAYGYRYVLYTPIGSYVGHHKIMQKSSNGYSYEPIPDGGEGSETPCFKSIQEAKHFYYPQWY